MYMYMHVDCLFFSLVSISQATGIRIQLSVMHSSLPSDVAISESVRGDGTDISP